MQIKVKCYAGYRGEETPRIICFGPRNVEVKEILDRWLDPAHRYFKILGDDKGIYIIRHNMDNWIWELIFYQESNGTGQ
ncbi:MAG: hypothetical protein P8X68_19995 [Desulfobacterales bacterium]|jgi:hypothetical protein